MATKKVTAKSAPKPRRATSARSPASKVAGSSLSLSPAQADHGADAPAELPVLKALAERGLKDAPNPSSLETTPDSRPRAEHQEKAPMTSKSTSFETVFAPTTEAFQAGYEKLQTAFGDAYSHSKANVEALTSSAKIAAEGVKQASEISLAYVQASAAQATEVAKSLGSVKSLQEAVEIQADYTKNAVATYFAEFTKVSDVLLAATKESAKPISERASALWSSIQSAR